MPATAGTDAAVSTDRLREFIARQGIAAEFIEFDVSCHSVADAAAATGAAPETIAKNICLLDADGGLIVAILRGVDRVSTGRVARALDAERPRVATPREVLAGSGYAVGGTPSFGFDATFLLDPLVAEQERVYSGGGSDRALVRIAPSELLRANGGRVARVRK